MMGWDKVAQETAAKEEKEVKKSTKAEKKAAAVPVNSMFTPIDEVEGKRGLNIALHGRGKTGKTTFGCTACQFIGSELLPTGPPLFIIDTHFGAKPITDNFPGENIHLIEIYEQTEDFEEDGVGCIRKLDEVIDSLAGLTDGTVLIDSFSDVKDWLNETLKIEILGKSKSEYRVQPADYFWRNAKVRSMMMKLIKMPLNVILTAEDKPVYQDAKLTETGLYEPDWYKKIPYWFDIVMELRKIIDDNVVRFYGYVTASRFQHSNKPVEFENPTFTKVANYFTKAKEGKT